MSLDSWEARPTKRGRSVKLVRPKDGDRRDAARREREESGKQGKFSGRRRIQWAQSRDGRNQDKGERMGKAREERECVCIIVVP